RGMHFQNAPDQEVKLVRCIRGAAFDVVIDLRPDSPAYKKWVAFEISDNNRSTIYIPAGCAHGFQALTNDMELEYHMSSPYCPEAARGVRWNDNAFSIAWPIPHPIMSERDAAFPDFQA
ncbi:MAG: dTDP-4-dehydrorhamnose 3,5-epimerase family protein, partial [Chloroflexia bacterium]